MPARFFAMAVVCGLASAATAQVLTQPPPLPPLQIQLRNDDVVRDARDAFQRKDKVRLTLDRVQAAADKHPLAPWVDYWDLAARLPEARVEDVEAFYARWPGSYVEDRLRNDWLLELGRRHDWANFVKDYPRFRMNDDREVTCYALIADQLAGKREPAELREAARRAWLAQRDPDTGCQAMAQTLYDAKVFDTTDVYRKLRQSVEAGRTKAARAAADIVGPTLALPLAELLDNPARYLAKKAMTLGSQHTELTALALARLAANDPGVAARLLADRWEKPLGLDHAAWAWAVTARQGAQSLLPDALDWSRNAWNSLRRSDRSSPEWSDETLGWLARAALRLGQGSERWTQVARAVDAMSPTERAEPAWVYWRARAQLALAKDDATGDAARAEARQALTLLAGQMNFYGQLAAEDTAGPQPLPARALPLTAAERDAARAQPGLQRALLLFGLPMRGEAVREWNFSLIGLGDRELLAAAQLACERQIWDRCINTSDRTRGEIDLDQRFPMPLRADVLAQARNIGLDPAYVYGLIRQESRFIMDARSAAGASGLMQVMPDTARWTAKRLGIDFRPEMLTDRDTNLKLGTAYLKLVLDDFGGSQALATAAYNAGPGRPRRWRAGPALDPAIWAENIPFTETRDYVKKVLSNATYYAGLLAGKPASLRARLGASVGPASPSDLAAVPTTPDLP